MKKNKIPEVVINFYKNPLFNHKGESVYDQLTKANEFDKKNIYLQYAPWEREDYGCNGSDEKFNRYINASVFEKEKYKNEYDWDDYFNKVIGMYLVFEFHNGTSNPIFYNCGGFKSLMEDWEAGKPIALGDKLYNNREIRAIQLFEFVYKEADK